MTPSQNCHYDVTDVRRAGADVLLTRSSVRHLRQPRPPVLDRLGDPDAEHHQQELDGQTSNGEEHAEPADGRTGVLC